MPADEFIWSKFHWGDFINDLPLRTCPLAAQGLWWRMLGRMFMAKRRGFLEDSRGRALTPELLASLEGQPVEQVRAALAELEAEAVFSRDEFGTIFSRRMVRDEAQRERGRFTGRKGGNPALKRHQPDEPTPSIQPPEWHPLAPAFEALQRTGKLDSLTFEGLALVANAHPKAELAKRFNEVATHAANVAGTVGDPVQWLKRRSLDMEERGSELMKDSSPVNQGPFGEHM